MRYLILFYSVLISGIVSAQSPGNMIVKYLDDQKSHYENMAATIWKWAEPGYLELKTTELMQAELSKAGFTIEKGIADIPTAFVASFGSGKPVIGILAEMDALPR